MCPHAYRLELRNIYRTAVIKESNTQATSDIRGYQMAIFKNRADMVFGPYSGTH